MWRKWAVNSGRVHYPSAGPVVREDLELTALAGDLAREIAEDSADGVIQPDEEKRIEAKADKIIQCASAMVAEAKGLI